MNYQKNSGKNAKILVPIHAKNRMPNRIRFFVVRFI